MPFPACGRCTRPVGGGMRGPVGLADGFGIYHSAWGVCFGQRGQELRTSQKSPGFLPPWHPLQPPLRTEADWLSSSFPFGPTSLMYPEASCLTSEDSIIVLICIRLGIFKLLFFLMFHKLSLTPGYDIGRLVLFPLYK